MYGVGLVGVIIVKDSFFVGFWRGGLFYVFWNSGFNCRSVGFKAGDIVFRGYLTMFGDIFGVIIRRMFLVFSGRSLGMLFNML